MAKLFCSVCDEQYSAAPVIDTSCPDCGGSDCPWYRCERHYYSGQLDDLCSNPCGGRLISEAERDEIAEREWAEEAASK